MDYNGFPDSLKMGFDSLIPGLDNDYDYPNFTNGFEFKDEAQSPDFVDGLLASPNTDPPESVPTLSPSSEGDGQSPSSDDGSDAVLKFITQMLMEESMEENNWMLHDSLALNIAEKSLYEVIGEKYPPSPNQPPLESPDASAGISLSSSSSPRSGVSSSIDPHPQYLNDLGEYQAPLSQASSFVPESTLGSVSHVPYSVDQVNLPVDSVQAANFFSEGDYIMQFKRGVEEASKFLPKNSNLVVDLDQYSLASEHKAVPSAANVKVEKVEGEHSAGSSRGRKREELQLEEERTNKHSAVYSEEAELSELFDKVLLMPKVGGSHDTCGVFGCGPNAALPGKEVQPSGGNNRDKKPGNNNETVDLRTLLILCAQAVSSDDRRTANELLKQIKQHSSPTGDGSQRLAHCFVNGLEARMSGNGPQVYTALASKKNTAADILKAYQLYLQASPFKKIALFFNNGMIVKAAENAKVLHIVDFGILYGFQWPVLIQYISTRPGGPPKLRITGIELPQPGFRPAQRVEETGRRLEKYCKRFNVPFEYHAIAKKWENIQIEDIKVAKDEVLAVNCLYRFKNLLDETVVVNSPRNAVLNLIRELKPDIFTHAVVNGSYNAPFFVTRFREALFHFTALFDMLDSTVSRGRDDPERTMFEQEFYGRDVINVISCEGSERVERPETYRQWQVRNTRAGFRQLPLDQEIMEKLKHKMKIYYHKDFIIDVDGCWMLLGWKGRVMYASSCWVPS